VDGVNADAIGAAGFAIDIARARVVTVASGVSIAGRCSFACEHYGIAAGRGLVLWGRGLGLGEWRGVAGRTAITFGQS